LEIRRGASKQSVIFGAHPDTDGYRVTEDVAIAPLPQWVIDAANGTADSPTPLLDAPPPPRRVDNSTIPPIPLERCLSKVHRDLLQRGVSEGSRDNSAIALALDAMGCERWLLQQAIAFEGNARSIVEDFAARCTPSLSGRDIERIYKSATKSTDGPATHHDALLNVVKKWERENRRYTTAPTVPTVKPDTVPPTVTGDRANAGDSQNPDPDAVRETVTAVTAILEEHDSEGERGIALDALAKHRGVSRRSLDLVIREIEGSAEIKESKPPMAPKSEDFDLKMLFGERLATAMEAAAASASIDPMMIAHYFLGAAGSVIGGKTRAWVGGDHTEPAIYWPVIVESSGEGKTRAYNFVSQWFKKRQAEENKAYEARKSDYEAKAAKWKRESGKGGAGEDTPPERPAPKHQVLINQATTEALIKALANNNGRGALMFRDEFSATFKMGQYKSRGGDDEETLLELYDGGTINVLRASEEGSLFAECSHACFAGGTQPDIFREIFADLNDSRGKQARFSFLVPKQCPPQYNENRHITLELPSLLDHIYGEILKKAAISPEKINLSDRAFHYWRQYSDRIKVEARAASTPPVLRTWLNKHANRAVRIALDLHFIDAALGQNDGDAISLNTIKRAIAFCEFLRSQFEFLQRQADTEGVEGVVSLIQSKTRAYGSIKARDFYRTHCKAGIAAIAKDQGRAAAAVTKELMEKAAQSDGFTVVQDGNSCRLEFSPKLGSVAKDEKVSDSGDSVQDIDIPTVVAVTDTGPVTSDIGDSDPKSETENPGSENKESENKDQEFTPKEGDDVWAWTALVDDPDLKEQWVQAQYLQVDPDGDQHMVVIGGLGYYVNYVHPILVEAVHGQ